ncbi:hypothetical protein [Propionivibrio sp.]|uniref:hypothetical protein n=1 Tax=Propionivibrio sp. TaxID=2212460 RepID=UPI0039E725AC
MHDMLKEKQKTRLSLLHKLYELSGGDQHQYINGGVLAEACGISDTDQFKTAIDYLEGEYLVETKRVSMGIPALLRIKHAGVVEVEGAFSKPNEPTSHFMPVNVLYVNQMVGSSIQQGTINSTQTSTISFEVGAIEELRKFVEVASTLIATTNHSDLAWQEIKAEIDTLQAQSESPKPKVTIVRECLNSISRLCEGAAAGALLLPSA